MFKKTLSFILIGLLLNLAFYSTARANSNPEKEAKFASKVKRGINKLGSGREVKVKVKMKDGTKIRGYISQINEDSFTVIDNLNKEATVPYSGVKQITGKNNLTGEEIAAIAGWVILIFLLVMCATTDCV